MVGNADMVERTYMVWSLHMVPWAAAVPGQVAEALFFKNLADRLAKPCLWAPHHVCGFSTMYHV